MKDTICVLISGIDNLKGSEAIALVDRFRLKEYPGVKLGQRGKFYYGDFIPEIDKDKSSIENLHSLTGLFSWLGLKKVLFRFDTASLVDSQVDFRLHMDKVSGTYISFPRISYMNTRNRL